MFSHLNINPIHPQKQKGAQNTNLYKKSVLPFQNTIWNSSFGYTI